MTDVDNRLSSIDIPNQRFVIASDENGTHLARSAAPLLVADPDSVYLVRRGRLDPRPAAIRAISACATPRRRLVARRRRADSRERGGYGVFLNQWAYSVQTAFARTLPFFFTKQVDVHCDGRYLHCRRTTS